VTEYDDSERGSRRAQTLGGGLAILAFLALLYGPTPLDPVQRRVAATTALTAILWITVAIPVGATSLLPVILFPLLGVMSAREAAPLYMSDLVLLFIGAFIIALGLERWNVHRRIALWIIARVGTSRRRLVLGFMVAAAFLSMWINNTATTLLMLPIALAVVQSVDDEGGRTTPFALCLLLGVAYSASVGGMATPVGTAPNQVMLGQFAERFPTGPKITFGGWFLGWLPLVILFVPLGWLLLTRVVFKVRAGISASNDVIADERKRQGPMTYAQKMMSLVFIATALLWVTRADLVIGDLRMPGWSRLLLGPEASDPAWYQQHKNDISDSTVAVLMAVLCFFIPVNRARGEFLMDWRTAVKIPWEVLILLGAGFCIARGFTVSGLDEVLGSSLSPLFEGHSSWVVVGAVCLFMSFLTEITSNTATTAVLLPVLASAAVAGGVNPLLVMAPATIAASAAFMLPVATPPNAVVFSSRLVPVPTMARAGFWLNMMTVGLITIVFQLWVRRIWGIGESLPDWAQ